jgi:hypothetical protein
MLQLAIYDQMHMCSIDTVGAFLYQEYPESLKPLYVSLPKAVAEVCNLNPKTTYRVKKYIYMDYQTLEEHIILLTETI